MTQFSASLWGDEGFAAVLAQKPIVQIVKILVRDTSPPLYYLCLHTWMKIFGTSEVAIRALSFAFFLGTIITVFFIGRLLWDKKTGLLAALLTATNPFLFHYAFEGRMYAILLFTSTLSVYFFLKKSRWSFILATTAALYSHHFSIFIVIFEGLWRLVEIRPWQQPVQKTLKNISDFFIIGLLYAPWLYPLYYQTSLVASGFWLGKPSLNDFKETVEKFVVGSGEETTRQLAYWLAITTLVLRNWLKDIKKAAFLLGWFLTPLALTFLISQSFQPIFFDRYMLMAIPASSLLMASARRKISFVPILAIVILLGSLNYHYFRHPSKRPFRDLASYIKREASGLILINHNATAHHLWESKYYGLEAPIYAPTPLPFYVGTALMEKEDLIQSLPAAETIGLITSAPVEEVKISNYDIVKREQFGDLKFLWLKKD